MDNGRVKKEIVDIEYDKVYTFYNNRKAKYDRDNPYILTMLQDKNPNLVKKRNTYEWNKLHPLMNIDKNSKILDVACGIGRWSDAITEDINEYCGIDFSEELISIAVERNKNLKNRTFLVGSVNHLTQILENAKKGKFDKVLVFGICVYLNEKDIRSMFSQIESMCCKNALICIREPVGINERLTLKDFYSQDLEVEYNSIYRTRIELENIFDETLLKKGFSIVNEGFLFEDTDLNNRKETSQYYYILQR
ncbi:MAG: class I SAM-dependent methyltransferase [Firmicutes bacterium]|nr:class I SAM-dependent methyltransferase [Bacillota bacterium]